MGDCEWLKTKTCTVVRVELFGITDPWSSDSDLSDLSPVEDEYAKVDKSERRRQRDAPDIGDVTVTASEDMPVLATNTVTSTAAAVTTAVASTPSAVPATTAYQTPIYESPATVTALPTTATDTL